MACIDTAQANAMPLCDVYLRKVNLDLWQREARQVLFATVGSSPYLDPEPVSSAANLFCWPLLLECGQSQTTESCCKGRSAL